MKKPSSDSLYDYIHNKLLEICNKDQCISYSDLSFDLTYLRIPKIIIPKLMKELEDKGMIVRLNQQNYKINGAVIKK